MSKIIPILAFNQIKLYNYEVRGKRSFEVNRSD
jgi:hypothetical protein